MSVIDEVLAEEHARSLRISNALKRELAELPRGSIRKRVIKGRTYYYLQYREGYQVKSDYVRRDEVEALRARLKRRKEVVASLREQQSTRKRIERVLGKGARP